MKKKKYFVVACILTVNERFLKENNKGKQGISAYEIHYLLKTLVSPLCMYPPPNRVGWSVAAPEKVAVSSNS